MLTEEDQEAPAAEEPADATEARPRRKRRRPRVSTVVAGLLALILVAGAAFAGWQWRQGERDERRGWAAVETGRDLAVKLVSVNSATADQDVRAILQGAVGDFGKIFSENLDSYVDIIRRGNVQATGQAPSAGLEKLDGNTATVLVAVKASVKNTQVPHGEDRTYRMSVQLVEQPDGRWLAQKVDFVP